ncbi:MAG: hypothetical protein QM528_06020 [Phycisphaerales bacterium]|nr:hypothetical protein [Phycisphaerales bacterium]
MSLSVSPPPYAPVATKDSIALVALYNNLNGNNWNNRSGWLSSYVSSWNGVIVQNGRVAYISLPRNNLSGKIPNEIGRLDSLKLLDCYFNDITGMSDSITRLAGLQYLLLGNNQLTGAIPDNIGAMTNLTIGDLSNNQLTGNIPNSISTCINLQQLILAGNQLSGAIANAVADIPNLLQLNLANNQFTTLPNNLNNLTNLQTLILDSNKLNSTNLDLITQLSKLAYLSLSNNPLKTTIPVNIGNLSNLYYLNMSYDSLTGSLPSGIGNLGPSTLSSALNPNLTINLSNNELAGSLVPLGGIGTNTATNATRQIGLFLILSNNKFTDLPDTLAWAGIPRQQGVPPLTISGLRQVYLDNNIINDTVPASFSICSSLELLYLNNNTQFGQNKRLPSLVLSWIALSGGSIVNTNINLVPATQTDSAVLEFLYSRNVMGVPNLLGL